MLFLLAEQISKTFITFSLREKKKMIIYNFCGSLLFWKPCPLNVSIREKSVSIAQEHYIQQ